LVNLYCYSQNKKNYTEEAVPGNPPALTHPTAGAFVDLDNNLVAGMTHIMILQIIFLNKF
jgi:hypothetical protein